MVRIILLCFIVMVAVTRIDTASITDAKTLFYNISTGYNKEVRPIADQSDTLTVSINMYLISIKDFDEVSGTMNILAVFTINWNDVSLVWNPAAYNGLHDINIGQNNIWLPKLYNIKASNTFSAISDSDLLVNIANNGEIIWQPAGFIDVKCSQDVSYFPFDRQTCSIQLAPWGYFQNKVQLQPQKTEVSLDFYETNGEWSLDRTITGTYVLSDISLTIFNITISRLPAFHIVNTLMPIYLLLVMNPLVFVLPVDSGERVGFSLTVFLTFTVFITIVNGVLPANSESMSRLSYFIFAVLVASGIIASINIFQLRLYHKDENLPVPRWLVRLMRILGCHCRKSRRRVIEVCPVNAIPKTLDQIRSKKGLTIQEEENATEGIEQDITWKDVVTQVNAWDLV
ncbi:neuronal acetylcholine receptor subunit alpha-2-like [Mizuhopecten yessoensis]|uniref:neuronal acetylcholine receptor subunit alpha-2-like n=1 Tax=Mizuhopecten yessoensis TaxID=6573 RepID=UPI000B458A40|nr:neuronal acetylcholine receptor subunit alpha-2-like [Mizuhopecten yessoensis]